MENRQFDVYVAVDWSAKGSPFSKEEKPNSIYIAWRENEGQGQFYRPFSRLDARDKLLQKFSQWTARGKRVLAGFDFAFGYPAGFAKLAFFGKSGPPWLRTWEGLEKEIWDTDINDSNRFEVANLLNKRINDQAPGPFWGMHHAWKEQSHLKKTKGKTNSEGSHWDEAGAYLRIKRHCDQTTAGTQETWKIYGNGSVGGQSLVGIPVLHYLRAHPELSQKTQVWPFETGFSLPQKEKKKSGLVVLAEIYPSELTRHLPRPKNEVLDKFQVRTVVERMAELDRNGKLADRFTAPTDLDDTQLKQCIEEEGWILSLK